MRIGLIDVDGHNFPNLALMKLSAFHKAVGDSVEWACAMDTYDAVFQSKVFDDTYSLDIEWLPQSKTITKGGTGYIRKRRGDEIFPFEVYVNGEWRKRRLSDALIPTRGMVVFKEDDGYYTEGLHPAIEHIYPDYSLYPELTKDTAYGYLTRGCPRQCAFCCVSEKEGCQSIKCANLDEFWRGQKYIKLLDPNLLCCRDRIDLLQQLVESKSYVSFMQGLDIRAMKPEVLDLLNRIKVKEIHFAWDNPEQDLTTEFAYYAGGAKHKPHGKYGTVYVLTNYGSTMEENLYRVYTLRDLGYDPYIMIYDKPNAPKEIWDLQRWCNNRWIFRKVAKFEEYKRIQQKG